MQLLALGLGEDAIDARLRGGRLHRLHRGVYAVGHGLVPTEGRWIAAVLRIGDGAVLSHRSAAALWGIGRGLRQGRIHVSAPRRAQSPPMIHRHRTRLAPDEATSRRRIPVTTLTRTLLDVASETSAEGLQGAIREAEYAHRLRIEDLKRLLDRHPGQRGTRTLRSCLHCLDHGPRGRTRSRLETRFAALIAHTELPRPALNAPLDVDGFKIEADCLWREQKLIVELDGARAHRTRAAFEADRERDRRLQAAGWQVIRVTWRQLDDPVPLLADLRRLLSSRSRFPAL
jgi:hypothetical protein